MKRPECYIVPHGDVSRSLAVVSRVVVAPRDATRLDDGERADQAIAERAHGLGYRCTEAAPRARGEPIGMTPTCAWPAAYTS